MFIRWLFDFISGKKQMEQEILILRREKLYLQGMIALKERFLQRLADKYPEVRKELDDLKLPPKREEKFVDSPV